jgi:asparagine synthase (glutamine-hydrolysing)
MTRFLAALWTPEDARATQQQIQVQDQLRSELEWGVAFETRGAWIASPRAISPPLRRAPQENGVVIGRLFEAGSSRIAAETLEALATPSAQDAARQLLDRHWGRYVALLRDRRTGAWSVLRDPSGGVECFLWRFGWLTLVSSDPGPLIQFRPTGLAIDWSRVGMTLGDPMMSTTRSALAGVHLLTPGALYACDRTPYELQLWKPATFARLAVANHTAAIDALRASTLQCVTAYGLDPAAAVVEISGGLDSAIVASTLSSVPSAKVAAWINFAVSDRGGDERV